MLSPVLCPRPEARPRAASAAQRLLWWLVLAMLLAPALGRIHQVLHPPVWPGQSAPGHAHSHAHGNAHSLTDAAVASTASQDDSGPWLLALFSGHGHADCQLHDQLNAWASAPAADQPLPVALPQQAPRHVAGRGAFAGSAAFFDPRAPPAVA